MKLASSWTDNFPKQPRLINDSRSIPVWWAIVKASIFVFSSAPSSKTSSGRVLVVVVGVPALYGIGGHVTCFRFWYKSRSQYQLRSLGTRLWCGMRTNRRRCIANLTSLTFDKIRGILEYCIEPLSLSWCMSKGVGCIVQRWVCSGSLVHPSLASHTLCRKERSGHLIVWPDNLVML